MLIEKFTEKVGEFGPDVVDKLKYLYAKAKSDLKDTENFHFAIGHKAYASWFYKDLGPKKVQSKNIDAEIGQWLLASIYLIEELVQENEELKNK